jgi:hypothetical protein
MSEFADLLHKIPKLKSPNIASDMWMILTDNCLRIEKRDVGVASHISEVRQATFLSTSAFYRPKGNSSKLRTCYENFGFNQP